MPRLPVWRRGPVPRVPGQGRQCCRTAGPDTDLTDVADLRDGVNRLKLPPGFQYRSFNPPTGNGIRRKCAGNHDGMAAFDAGAGRVLLIRNHEVNGSTAPTPPTPTSRCTTQRPRWRHVRPGRPVRQRGAHLAGVGRDADELRRWTHAMGLVDLLRGDRQRPRRLRRLHSQRPAAVTAAPTPRRRTCRIPCSNRHMDTSSRCRPTARVSGAGDPGGPLLPRGSGLRPDQWVDLPHGRQLRLRQRPLPLRPAGRPPSAKRIEDGGTLWMLGIAGTSQANLSGTQMRGTQYQVRWVQIADPNPQFPMANGLPTTTNNQAISNVGRQGCDDGAAVFSRLEGITWDKGVVYFTSTQGGGTAETVDWDVSAETRNGFGRGTGQVWAYQPVAGSWRSSTSRPARRSATARQRHRQPTGHPDPLRGQCRSENRLQALTRSGDLVTFAERSDPPAWSSPAPPSPRTARRCTSTSTRGRPERGYLGSLAQPRGVGPPTTVAYRA